MSIEADEKTDFAAVTSSLKPRKKLDPMNQGSRQLALVAESMILYLRYQADDHVDLKPACPRSGLKAWQYDGWSRSSIPESKTVWGGRGLLAVHLLFLAVWRMRVSWVDLFVTLGVQYIWSTSPGYCAGIEHNRYKESRRLWMRNRFFFFFSISPENTERLG